MSLNTTRTRRIVFAVVAIALLAACASVAPGNDPVVVHTQQALGAADVIYAESMRYYFTPGVAPNLSPSVVKVFETVRTGFDPAYKAVQIALDTYRALKTAESQAALKAKSTDLALLLNPVTTLTPSKPKPIEVN